MAYGSLALSRAWLELSSEMCPVDTQPDPSGRGTVHTGTSLPVKLVFLAPPKSGLTHAGLQ